MTSLRCLPTGLFLLGALATAGAQVAPTFLTGDELIAPAAGNQSAPRLCAGGDQILAVWVDSRSAPIFTGEQSGQDIWAARVDANGALIDVTPFPVSLAAGDQKTPRVAWNGSHWLVAWVSQVSTEFYYTEGIVAARVAPDGSVLDPEPIVVQADTGSGTFGDVASDGNGWAAFFTGWDVATAWVWGKRIAADGTLLDAAPKGLFSPGGSPYTPYGVSAEWAGGRYLVTWSQWSTGLDNVRGRMLDAALQPQGAAFNVATASDYEVHPDVATNGSEFYVVWDRYNNCCVGGASKVYGTRVTTAGAVLDGAAGVAIYDTNGYGFQGSEPAVGWDGVQWVASWTEPATGGLRVNAGRISAAGVVLDFNGFEVDPVPPRQEASVVVGRPGGGSLVAWQDSRVNVGQAYDIFATRLDAAAVPVALGSLANSAPAQVHADSASTPDGGALLAWTSMNSGLTRILVQGVTREGEPLALPVELASGTTLGRARVAWSGAAALVTWDGPGGVFARRAGADGTPIDGAPFLVMPGAGNDVAAQGDTFLVTALVPEPNPEYVNARSRRVSATTGAVLDAASVLVGATYATSQAVEAFDGGFLVAWQKHATHDQPYSSIWLRLVSVANVPGAQSSFSTSSSYNALPALAAGDGAALLAWQLGPSSSISQDVLARVIGPGLSLAGGNISVSAAAYSQQAPAVAWDGTQWVVAWQDLRATQDYLFDRRTDLYAARVSAAGVLLDPAGLALATDAAPEAWPTVAALGSGSALVGWSDLQPQAPVASYRVAFTLLGGVSAWVDLGDALAGAGGEPMLAGSGTLAAGSPVELQLTGAAPLAPAVLVVGFSVLDAPFKGGVLVPSPDALVAGLVTGPTGALLLAGTWPAGVPSGTALVFQEWIQDVVGPQGWSASNALQAFAP
jgi:hypothetical protein